MYAGRVVCCHLVSHVQYAPHDPLRLEKSRDKQTDRKTPDRYITLTAIRYTRPAYVVQLTYTKMDSNNM